EEHAARCPDCRRRHEHAVALMESLRRLAPPALHPGFIDQALSRATRPAAGASRAKWRPVLGMALAASLVLGVALGVFLATRPDPVQAVEHPEGHAQDRKSTRLNSSHLVISYAVFCLKKKKKM